MDDAFIVCRSDRLGKSGSDREDAVDRHFSFGNDAVEGLTFDELHREEVDAVCLLDRIDGDDARVVERSEGFRLTSEAIEPLRHGGHLGRKHLECNLSPEPGVGRAIHLAHPARADRSSDAVVRELLADQDKALQSRRPAQRSVAREDSSPDSGLV